ncbi:MAG TPA: Fic family protein [Anaeromyxobacteraceae bacterium]|nr:Fic family protein [Anaeromyxobacteraceae bacterium]
MQTRFVEIDDRNEDVKDLLGEDEAIALDFLTKYELSLFHHENALEGTMYSVHELSAALSGITVAEASTMKGYREITNDRAALEWVRTESQSKKLKVTLATAQTLYRTLGLGFDDEAEAKAELRAEVPLHRTYFHEIAPPAKIPALLEKLWTLCDSADFRQLHPIQQSSRFQYEFMRIFPFTDRSGKIARLIGNLHLMHARYLPCVIHSIDRQRYFESFRFGEPHLRDLLLDSVDNALSNAEKYLKQALRARARRAAR